MSRGLTLSVSQEYRPIIEKVATIVHKISGNKFGEKQSFMIESRIKKRMMELTIQSPEDYLKFIEANKAEVNMLVGLMTTHHTFFFREFAHFELLKSMLPKVVTACKQRGEKTIKIWSAACSRGHEVYSLAMFMETLLPTIDPSLNYKILGTDIDGESVRLAQNGVYHHNELKEVPMNFLGDHWAKGTGEIASYSKAKKHIREKCEFKVGNLLKVKETVGSNKFDIIFCRNVFIYFEPSQIEIITKDLLKSMYSDGVFFSGMSESLMGLKLEVTSVGPSVYVHAAAPEIVKPQVIAPKSGAEGEFCVLPTNFCVLPSTLKVMCVDDSPSILTLLKKILSREKGFEVVATASNGIEAIEVLKKQKVDLMTLDIHMPEMDGITYLKKNFSKDHPPVVMVSSASRNDADVAIQALTAGASDYVEKPSLLNLEDRGDEIRNKLRSLYVIKNDAHKLSSMDQDFQTRESMEHIESKLRLVMASVSDVQKIVNFFNEANNAQPPTVILLEGYGEVLEAMVNELRYKFKQQVSLLTPETKKLEVNGIYFGDARKVIKNLQVEHGTRHTSILCYGIMSRWAATELSSWKDSHIILEDFGPAENIRHPLYGKASDTVPATSFYYLSNLFLVKK
jgi:chemotaxis protein methyltransferase CheR